MTRTKERMYRHRMGCLTDCIAYVLKMHPEQVPFFVLPRRGWNRRLKRFLRRRGYHASWRWCATPPKRSVHIVCGNSLVWKRAAHVVVYRNGRVAYDPTYPSKWSKKRITHRLVMRKI